MVGDSFEAAVPESAAVIGESGSRDELLESGRRAYARRAWNDAFVILSRADETTPLSASDLELLAWSAGLTGRDDKLFEFLDRLYQTHLAAERYAAAARAAFWLCLRLFALGEASRAAGWHARAQRMVERQSEPGVEEGYLLLPAVHGELGAARWPSAETTGSRALAIGERFGDANLVALAQSLQAQAIIHQGRVEQGLRLLDEAMLAATNNELLPLVTGLIYCSAIAMCLRIHSISRSREWTRALASWCDSQPDLIPFAGACVAHRTEILGLSGAWNEAIEEARKASARIAAQNDRRATADVWYQQAEIFRMQGDFSAAEDGYRLASEHGRDTQPGLALLRIAQSKVDDAVHGIERALGAVRDPLRRTRLLPAYVEIMLASGNLDGARAGAEELEAAAEQFGTEALDAIASHARGAVLLAEGDPSAALPPLRRAFGIWNDLGAPYIAARIRVLVSQACQALGDRDGARLEQDAARATFERLGAGPELSRLEKDGSPAGGSGPRLTAREIQVLRLVAAGKTNRAIANDLSLSEKTVDRHLSNIFTKIDVSSRAAATAYAYQQGIV